MKYFDPLRNINRVMILITAILYITIYLGMLFQIVLGIYQVMAAIMILFSFNSFLKKDKIRIIIYWFIVVVFAIFWGLGWLDAGHEIFPMAIYPMSIAIYFTFFLEKLGTQNIEES